LEINFGPGWTAGWTEAHDVLAARGPDSTVPNASLLLLRVRRIFDERATVNAQTRETSFYAAVREEPDPIGWLQHVNDRVATSAPTGFVLGDARGTYFDASVVPGKEYGARTDGCLAGCVILFALDERAQVVSLELGVANRFYVLDRAGEPVVVLVSASREEMPRAVEEAEKIIATMTFVAG